MTDDSAPAIQVRVDVQQRGKNDAWVALEIATPLNFFSVAFPPDQADELAQALPGAFQNAVKECRRIQSGLLIADNSGKVQ